MLLCVRACVLPRMCVCVYLSINNVLKALTALPLKISKKNRRKVQPKSRILLFPWMISWLITTKFYLLKNSDIWRKPLAGVSCHWAHRRDLHNVSRRRGHRERAPNMFTLCKPHDRYNTCLQEFHGAEHNAAIYITPSAFVYGRTKNKVIRTVR